jgi:hypothetical protein
MQYPSDPPRAKPSQSSMRLGFSRATASAFGFAVKAALILASSSSSVIGTPRGIPFS